MTTTRERTLAIATVMLACSPFGVACAESKEVLPECIEAVEQFLAQPTKQILSLLQGIDDQSCWTIMGSTNENLNRLVRLVETGNPWSATYLVSHLKHLDGGNLEDSLIAIGMFGDHDAEGLLTFAKSGNLSDRELKSVLMMLPLSMSDDLDTQFRIMQERRMRVARVSRLDLAGKKDMALKSIDEFLTRLAANK